jgi:hypothetical protein
MAEEADGSEHSVLCLRLVQLLTARYRAMGSPPVEGPCLAY